MLMIHFLTRACFFGLAFIVNFVPNDMWSCLANNHLKLSWQNFRTDPGEERSSTEGRGTKKETLAAILWFPNETWGKMARDFVTLC